MGGAARGGVTLYGGAYSDYLRARRAERARWEQEWREQRGEISRLKAAVSTTAREVSHARPMKDRNKPAYDRHGEQVQRGVSRRVRNARVRLDRLLAHRIAKPPAPLRFSAELTAETRAEGPALSLRNVVVPGRLGLDRLDVSATERLLVTGPNGAGKSTLLAVLTGRLVPGPVFERPRSLRRGAGGRARCSVAWRAGPNRLARPGAAGRRPQRRTTPKARPGDPRRPLAARPPPGRAHEPHLARPRRGAGGGSGVRARHYRRRHPRSLAQAPLGRSRTQARRGTPGRT